MPLLSVNPTTGVQIDSYPEMTAAEVDQTLAGTHAAFIEWRRSEIRSRATLLRGVAAELRSRGPALARLMALEMGKPVADGESEIEKCAAVCDYYAEGGARFLEPEEVASDASRSFVTYQPLGIVLAVMPWNFPFWQVFRFAAPTLLAGNAGVLKHASNVTACALAIEDLFKSAGAPPGLFRTLRLGSARIGEVIDDPRVAAVTVTGSTPAGRAIAARAGQALKKSVLELGGSDPYLILDDADLESTVATCVKSRLINAGQSCIAAKRFIVSERHRGAVEQLFVAGMAAQTMGDPMQPGTTVGPQARHDLRDDLHQQVTDSVARGARVLIGGEVPVGAGAFYPPTVLTNVTPGMPAHDEELFGPVAAIIVATDERDAIRIANASSFGLGAAVFTTDVARGTRIAAEELEAGSCFVNTFVRSDPRLPFGGIKESGYGRELGLWGIREFVNVKTVYVA